MITDAMLREATGEAESFLLAHLPEPQPHQFSPRFERRMRKLISREKHPIRYRVLRYAAAMLLAILTLFGSVLAVSPEARASVNGWVRRTIRGKFYYYFTGGYTPPPAEYELAALRDGLRWYDIFDSDGGKTYLYLREDESLVEFRYVCAAEAKHYSMSFEGMGYHEVTVNGWPADLYLAINKDYTSMIVWVDPVEGTLFHIVAHADREELIALAESVRKIEKSE